MSRPIVQLSKDLRRSVAAGHPWLFNRAVELPAGARAGEVVEVRRGSERLATGVLDPTSPIAVRILERDPDAAIDADWVRDRARQAACLRISDPQLLDSDALRLIHGEGDLMPGLVVDVYAGTAVVVFDGAGAEAFWRPRLAEVLDGAATAGIELDRVWARRSGEREGELLVGDPPPETLFIREHGARFEVDVRRGQKTGFFLDQRANRRRVADLAAGGDVLNLFCYTGGFSVLAALGGAARVTSVDFAKPAVAAARRNFTHSGIDTKNHEFETIDAFEFLASAAARGSTWDLVIVDPPSFAPNERVKPRALEAYRRLNALALQVVGPGGQLVTASCSSHVTMTEMLAVLADASRATGRIAQVQEVRGADRDHPVLPAFPEGQYLKCLFAFVR